jgi:putative FmdB family regulatory protein
MPLYEYQCEACGERFELIRKFSDPALEVCEKCGKGPVTRLMSSPAIKFKGSGWYITDYAKKGSTSSTDSSSSSTKSSEASADKPAAGSDTTKADAPAKPATPAAGSKD